MTDTTGDAAVIRIKGTDKAIAVKTDCNPRYVYLNPYRGAEIAVAEAARNVVCVGAEPLAITNCLNFGNPYKPEIFWQFKEAVRGIGDACRVLETPVTGGNVSFYNESPSAAIYPTPVIGMLGLLESQKQTMRANFTSAGVPIVVLGAPRGSLGGSEYLKLVHGITAGDAPELDLGYEKRLQGLCLRLIREGLILSAHDVSEGGIAVTIAESCIWGRPEPVGAVVRIESHGRPDADLFGEDQSRIVISARRDDLARIRSLASDAHIHYAEIGTTGGEKLQINDMVSITVEEMRQIHGGGIERVVERI